MTRFPRTGGWGGIRTHGGREPTAVFKTAALNHSATHPCRPPCDRFDRGALALGRSAVQAKGQNELSCTRKVVSYKRMRERLKMRLWSGVVALAVLASAPAARVDEAM